MKSLALPNFPLMPAEVCIDKQRQESFYFVFLCIYMTCLFNDIATLVNIVTFS